MIRKFLLLSVFLLLGCQNSNNSELNNSKKTSDVVVKTETYKDTSFEEFPEEKAENISKDDNTNISTYLKTNNIFESIPYKVPEKYLAKFSGDGAPVFFSGDGAPVFFTKAENNTNTNLEIEWSRTENQLLLDYLHLTNKIEKNNESVSYGRYSQVIEHNISIDNNKINKKVNLVKSMAFSIVKNKESYKTRSITPIVLRPINSEKSNFLIRSLTFTSSKNKIIIHDDKKLFPLEGISLKTNLASNKFKFYVEIARTNNYKAEDISVIASVDGKQYTLTKFTGDLYTTDIEISNKDTSKNLIVEVIDKKSLTSDIEYNGLTWIIPMSQ
ncbi:MAG: hypothetical protein AABZ74_00780 [Cyanobacteriota bacterium]